MFISHALGGLTLVLVALTIFAVLYADGCVMLFAPGFLQDSEPTRFILASDMLRITFPYLCLISITGF